VTLAETLMRLLAILILAASCSAPDYVEATPWASMTSFDSGSDVVKRSPNRNTKTSPGDATSYGLALTAGWHLGVRDVRVVGVRGYPEPPSWAAPPGNLYWNPADYEPEPEEPPGDWVDVVMANIAEIVLAGAAGLAAWLKRAEVAAWTRSRFDRYKGGATKDSDGDPT